MWYQRGPSLDSSISQGGYFLTVELLPFLPIKCLQIKGKISFKIHSTGNLDSLSYKMEQYLNSGINIHKQRRRAEKQGTPGRMI
jgi:hypothetical protein